MATTVKLCEIAPHVDVIAEFASVKIDPIGEIMRGANLQPCNGSNSALMQSDHYRCWFCYRERIKHDFCFKMLFR